jgi:hypothetical protein
MMIPHSPFFGGSPATRGCQNLLSVCILDLNTRLVLKKRRLRAFSLNWWFPYSTNDLGPFEAKNDQLIPTTGRSAPTSFDCHESDGVLKDQKKVLDRERLTMGDSPGFDMGRYSIVQTVS